MHPSREGTRTHIKDGLYVIEYNELVVIKLDDINIHLDELEVNTLRNILSTWKNAKFNRGRREASKKFNNSVRKRVEG